MKTVHPASTIINHLNNLFMLKYCLVDNRLAKDEKNFVAMVSSPVTMTLDKLIDEMISEGTGLTRPQALAYFE